MIRIPQIRISRFTAAMALSALLLLVAVSPTDAADQYSIVTPANIQSYCNGSARLVSNNAYGWRCGGGASIDMGQLCYNLTRLSNAFDRLANFYNAQTGWECWSWVTGRLRGLSANDFSDYCRRFGYSGVVLVSNDAYGWRCNSPNRQDGFSVAQACQLLLNQPAATDRIVNFYDPHSWECWN